MALQMAYKVQGYSSSKHGRAICNARNHHIVADDGGGDELGAGELFFSGVAACAVNMVERVAKNENIRFDHMNVDIEAYRDNEKPQGPLSVYDDVRIHFKFWNLDADQAQHLVSVWKQR